MTSVGAVTEALTDSRYLRDDQYREPGNLGRRAALHIKYSTATERWFPWLATQIDWAPAAAVLDLGCGPGWFWAGAAPVLPPGLRLTLADLSHGMLRDARTRLATKYRSAEFVQADASALPFGSDHFHVVVAGHMLYHLPDIGRAVAEVSRVLRPDGVLLASTEEDGSLQELHEIRREVFGGDDTARITRRFSRASGEPLLAGHFGRVEWRSHPDELRCTDPDDVLAWLTSIPPGSQASADQRRRLRRAVQDRFAGTGEFRITKRAGAFVASQPVTGDQ